MSLLMTLADASATGAFMNNPSTKNWLMIALIAIAILAFAAPQLWEKMKGGLKSLLTGLVDDAKNLRDRDPRQGESPTTGPTLDVSTIIQKRVQALKAACPKAAPEQRLRWLEQGFDETRAQTDYIASLEQQLDSAKVQAQPTQTPAAAATTA